MEGQFLDFDIGSTSDEETPKDAREERIRRAFEKSKETYKDELVNLTPGWFQCAPQDISETTNDRFGLKNIDASIQRLYYQRRYQDALDLTITFLDGMDAGTIAAEGKADARDRELLDIAMKCAIRLQDSENAGMLADRSKHRWGPHSSISATAAETYLVGHRPRDAITALLQAVHVQTQTYPHLRILARALNDWMAQLESSPSAQLDAIRALHDHVVVYCQRVTGAFARPLFSDIGAAHCSTLPPYNVVPRTDVEAWCTAAGFEGDELDALLSVVTFKGGEESSMVDEIGTGKSVRSL